MATGHVHRFLEDWDGRHADATLQSQTERACNKGCSWMQIQFTWKNTTFNVFNTSNYSNAFSQCDVNKTWCAEAGVALKINNFSKNIFRKLLPWGANLIKRHTVYSNYYYYSCRLKQKPFFKLLTLTRRWKKVSHQGRLVFGRHEADLVQGGERGASDARRPRRGQRVPGVAATRRWVGLLDSWTLAAFLFIGHPGLQKLFSVPIWHHMWVL